MANEEILKDENVVNEEEMVDAEVRIALVDDHALFRSGLKGLLSQRDGFKVVDTGCLTGFFTGFAERGEQYTCKNCDDCNYDRKYNHFLICY